MAEQPASAPHLAHPEGCAALRIVRKRLPSPTEREVFIDNLLVRIHSMIVMIRWTGLAPWEFEIPFSGSLTSTFQHTTTHVGRRHDSRNARRGPGGVNTKSGGRGTL